MEILDDVISEFPDQKPNVHIINHEKNKGLPQARKTGVSIAQGEYIAHCDSDDWINPDLYEILYTTAINKNADLVWCDYYRSDGINHIPVKTSNQPVLMQGPVWNKLVKKTVYDNGIVFPHSNKGEDGVIMTQLSFYAKNKVYVNCPLYYYYINPNSICNLPDVGSCLKRFEQEVENVKLKESFLIGIGVSSLYKGLILRWKILSRKNLLPIIDHPEYRKLWRATFRDAEIPYLLSGKINWRHKIGYLLVLLHLNRYCHSLLQKWL